MIPVLIMLLLALVSPSIEMSTLDENDSPQATSGRQGSLDVDCSGYTFEDLFEYDFALFTLDINDDWATGVMDAKAWVNGSKSAIVRDNLDSLFEGTSGGNDDWISTDEREAVRAIGPKCIADMETRLGIREGPSHRGNVDWNDLEFVEDGIALDEVNLVPEGHEQERDCAGLLSSNGCKEVPVTVTDDLEIHLLIAENENHNVRFDQLPNQGSSNFTLAMNVTNITDAQLVMTFPVQQGLRVSDLGFFDDGVANEDLVAPVSEFLPDGRLRVVADVDYPIGSYPMVRELFVDFTTMAPFTNDAPVWSPTAPADGTIIPIGTTYGEMLATSDADMWVVDESGWGLQCVFTDAGWNVRMDEIADLYVTANGASAVGQCMGVDAFGAETEEHRNYTFGKIMDASAVLSSSGEVIEFTTTSTGVATSLTVMAHAHQMTKMGPDTTAVTNANGIMMELSMTGLSPGDVMVMGTATASGMLDYEFMFDFGLEKISKPPAITINTNLQGEEAEWDINGQKFILSGNVIDPDGEDVQMTLSICGNEATNFDQEQLAWEIQVPIASCIQGDYTSPYTVVIVAEDESGKNANITIQVDDPNADGSDNSGGTTTTDEEEAEGSILPAPGMFATLLIGLVAAGWVSTRRD
ncbi:MAG: hypothetical protein QGF34_05685 [Candidatus Poseidoniaceae archaeon]|nr:hypothetical protein [Candidatus Poseidoniaceae archaeon]